MSLQKNTPNGKDNRASITLLGHVKKSIPPVHPPLPEKAQIVIEETEHMYREIRVENKLDGDNGQSHRLKLAVLVDVRIEADSKWTVRKSELN